MALFGLWVDAAINLTVGVLLLLVLILLVCINRPRGDGWQN